MQLFVEQLINGWALGSLYALFGIGFGLVFSTLGILNAAHGTYASWAAIIGYYAVERFGVPFPVAIAVGRDRRRPHGRRRGPDRLPAAPGQEGRHARRADHQHRVLDHPRQPGRFRDRPAEPCFPGLELSQPRWSRLGRCACRRCRSSPSSALLVCTVGIYLLIQKTRIGAAMRAVGWNEVAAASRRRELPRRDPADGLPGGATSGSPACSAASRPPTCRSRSARA